MKWQQTVQAADLALEITAEFNAPVHIDVRVEPVADLPDTFLIRVNMQADERIHILNFSIDWRLPAADMHGLYFGGNPMAELSYLPFWERQRFVCANSGLPFMALIHRAGDNRAAFGLLDQITETKLSANLSEITRCYHMQVQKPANKDISGQRIPMLQQREEVFFFSRAQVEWPEVLRFYTRLADSWSRPSLMPVPEQAFDPVFCTWTAVHHDISHEWIMRNARMAADLGFRTWITDDGWFIGQGRFADYSLAGDWQPNETKFPDFVSHVQAVKALGFRYILWTAPFMVGKDSQAAKRYAHMLTNGQERERFNNLSPWHTETADIVSDLLLRLVSDYQLDGLKIDFLDSIRVHSERVNGANDYTLGEGIHSILKHATERLLAVKPDLLIEFRNSYANLASRSYANVYRSSDVPINFTLNRWQAVMLRLLVPDRAVHLDPALWHPSDTDENVAVHLINCIVSVPMVSIALDQYPQTHLDIVRHWIGFYNAHRDTIAHGEFKPILHLGHVPVIYFQDNSETIIGLYDDDAILPEFTTRSIWILNASTRNQVNFLNSDHRGSYHVVTRDKFGQTIAHQTVTFPVPCLEVEVGGSLEFIANSII